MPMLRIQSHDLGDEPEACRRIELACAPQEGGRVVAAIVPGAAAAPAVGYVTRGANGRLRVAGWFPRSQFQRLRAALAKGGTLQLFFDLRDPGARLGYLTRIGLRGPGGVLALATAAPALARVPARARSTPPPSRFVPV